MTTHYERSDALQRQLAAEADRILAEHARVKSRRGQINQHHVERPAQPTPEQAEQEAFTRALIGRMAKRDETGAGSGEPG